MVKAKRRAQGAKGKEERIFDRKELRAAKPQPKGRRDFTAETRSSQSSESILTKKLFTLRPPRLRGESSDNLRTPRKLSRIAMQSSQKCRAGFKTRPYGPWCVASGLESVSSIILRASLSVSSARRFLDCGSSHRLFSSCGSLEKS